MSLNYSTYAFQGASVYMERPIIANTVRIILFVLKHCTDGSILCVRSIGMEMNDRGLKS